ncbi:MAG: hypothetical protein WCT12_20305, partial [Verrucomicrobiota bacterium]
MKNKNEDHHKLSPAEVQLIQQLRDQKGVEDRHCIAQTPSDPQRVASARVCDGSEVGLVGS